MRNLEIGIWSLAVLLSLTAAPAAAQSIETDGNIETDAQLVSKVATGTSPLAVSSTTMVPGLNADQVDGVDAAALALDADLQSAEALLAALQAQVDALGLALVPRTGQTTCYDAGGAVITCGSETGLAQDGDLQLGVTWPNPRFTDNSDGTVTDNLTTLIWLSDGNCFGTQTWVNGLAEVNALHDGCSDCGGTDNDCGLSDGSIAGEWRMPNVRELQSLVHYGVSGPAVPDTAGTGKWTADDPFSVALPSAYWTSTTLAFSTYKAWYIDLNAAELFFDTKANSKFLWPVRGGQ